MVIIPGRNPPDIKISDTFIRFMLGHNFLAHYPSRNHMIIWYEQLAASPDRPSSDRIPGPIPPGTKSPDQISPDRILSKSRNYPSPVISSTVVILLPSCKGLPTLPSWCLASFLPAHVCPSADLPDCLPAFLPCGC